MSDIINDKKIIDYEAIGGGDLREASKVEVIKKVKKESKISKGKKEVKEKKKETICSICCESYSSSIRKKIE